MLLKQKIILLLLSLAVCFQVSVLPTFAQAQDNPDAPLDKGTWAPDTEVAKVAKGIRRSQDFLDWILTRGNVPNSGYTPIISNWKVVRNASYAFAVLIIVATGFLLMIRRNKDINLLKFLPLFIGLMAYVTFSFAITKELYQLTEGLIKNFYRLEVNPQTNQANYIGTKDLLHVEWDYASVEWSRRAGIPYDESADTSMLLTKLTTWTYMSMSGILILRQVILWFFIIVSPFLALLVPFPLVRNTAKIWIGEFFRWLLYGLLFSVFLRGLVEIWRRGIPLQFTDFGGGTGELRYPNGVNYQLAGPNYALNNFPALRGYSGVHNIDTYVNYVVALIMLWVVIILPWILLRIFRDIFSAWLKSDSAQGLMGQLGTLYAKYTPGGDGGGASKSVSPREPAPPLSPAPAGAGQALELPFRKVNIVARDVAVNQDISNTISVERGITEAATNELTKLMGMAMPKITDIAKMEMNSREMTKQWEQLQKIGNPNIAASPVEQQRMASMRTELTRRANAGDERAQSILQAAQSAAAVSSQAAIGTVAEGTPQNAESIAKGAQRGAAAIAAAAASGNLNASRIVSQAKAGSKTPGRIMPVVNKVQSVSLNDYEEVKKMWVDHYKKGDVPQTGKFQNRKEWIIEDIEKAESAVSMLGNINPQVKQKGLEMVAALLPFLLLGGFSEQETIAYMKAKVEAAKQVLNEMEAQEQGKQKAEAETENVELERGQKRAQAEGHLEAEVEPEEPKISAEAIENQNVSNSITAQDVTKSSM